MMPHAVVAYRQHHMPTRTFNPKIVEESAQKLLLYEKIMQLHLVELRKNPDILTTHALVSQSPSSTHAGQRWPPEPHQRDAYMEHMDKICSGIPLSDTE
jgi:hypothetical protein